MHLRHGQDTLDHGAAGGEAQAAAGFREAGKGLHDLPDHRAVNVIHTGHIQDDVMLLFLDGLRLLDQCVCNRGPFGRGRLIPEPRCRA